MVKRDSLGEQFRTTVAAKIRLISSKSMRELLHKAAQEICDNVRRYEKEVGMKNYTGNAYRSFTIGIYEDGNLIDIVTTEDKDPTMRTLRKGQAYPLEEYYDGGEVGASPYVGTKGRGGQWGPTLGTSRIRIMRTNSRARWQMLCIVPVEYAPFDNANHIHNMLCAARDDMSDVVCNCAIKIKVADSIKEIPRRAK